MKSIKWKLTILYLGLVLIVMIASGTFIIFTLQNQEEEKAKEQLALYAQKVAEQVTQSYEESEFQLGLNNFILPDASGIQGSILDALGITIASTEVRKPPYPEYKNSVVVSALAGKPSFHVGKRETDINGLYKEWMSYAIPVTMHPQGGVKYVIFTQMDAKPMRESLNQTRKTISISVLLAFLLTAVVGYIFAKTLTGPIAALTGKAKELALGNLNQKITVRSEDEIGQLTESFNYMAAALNKTLSQISNEKNKLEIILHTMTDGVLSFDRDGNLSHSNFASLEILGEDSICSDFSEFVQKYELESEHPFKVSTEVPIETVFSVGDKFVRAFFSPYVNETKEVEGIIVVLQDITEQKKLDDMRREFVANVSHELRTPLTTIKSYAETLLDEESVKQNSLASDFLSIIDSESDRMAFLVQDLLQLSRFDNQQIQFHMTRFSLFSFVNGNIRQNRMQAENKGQHVSVQPFDEKIMILADKERITQVFYNIVTNAIKYSMAGAEITIFLSEDSAHWKLHVKDTGIGIQKTDLPLIFERFYRVDKARSRAMGGTGLGLAIAKEIMEKHGGKLTAESEYGKGTTLTMWFLKNMPGPGAGEEHTDGSQQFDFV